MKVIKTKLIQKCEGRKRGKYQITLEVTDYDLDMFEDLATTYAPFDTSMFIDKNGCGQKKAKVDITILDFKHKYRKWTMKVYHCFWKLWNRYD